jgi:hypothetical protein
VKKVKITDFWLAWNDPPFPYVAWNEDSIRKYLIEQGFVLNKKISKRRNFMEGAWEFWQGEDKNG